MSSGLLLHGTAFIDGALRDGVVVRCEGEEIVEVASGVASPPDARRIAGTLVPGFVDLHVHGGDGGDFMDADVVATRRVCAFHARHGTTTLLATTLSASRGAVSAAIATAVVVAQAPARGEARIGGIHLEGPYLNPSKAGAQDPAALRAADGAEVEEWLATAGGLPVLMTVAPEVPGVLELIATHGGRMRFSLGHTDASVELATGALERGARHFTHLWNAMPPLHHRRPGVVGAALAAEEATVELIADGLHVHPTLLLACGRLLGGRVCLVTDAMRAAGMPPGDYKLAALDVVVGGNAARLADGTLAGSLLTTAAAVRTMVAAGMSLVETLPLATSVPARALGLADRGSIAAGSRADFVELDDALRVARVWIGGVESAGEEEADA